MGYWITHSGKHIYPDNMSKDDICLEDIAHHLTKICRYGGGLPLDLHYSVAQHATELVKFAYSMDYPKGLLRLILLHDASEAYLGDIVSSLKAKLPCYKSVEKQVEDMIKGKYGVRSGLLYEKVCKRLDTSILLDEARCIMPHHLYAFEDQMEGVEPLGIDIVVDDNLERVKERFLGWCRFLGVKDE